MTVNVTVLPRSQWWRRLSVVDFYLWAFRLAVVLVILWGITGTVRAARYPGDVWIDFVIFGLSQGAIYALIALGYTMVYGILRMINFAHGDIFMVGAYTAFYAARALFQRGIFNRSPLLSLVIILAVAMGVSLGVALLVERVAYRPLRRAPRLVPLISAIGASFFIEYAVRGLYGSGFQAYPEFEIFKGMWTVLGIGVLRTQAVVIVASVILMAALYLFVMRTKTGTAMRSVSEDIEVAALMGINVDRIIVITFAIGGAAAGSGRPRNSRPLPVEGRHGLHHAGHGPDLPAIGHPRRAAGPKEGVRTMKPERRWRRTVQTGFLWGAGAGFISLVG